VDVPPDTAARLEELGGRPVNLYRALANQPEMLTAWVEFAWAVRRRCRTPRRLRELMIVRAARLTRCDYERIHHEHMAARAGVSREELDALDEWRQSNAFEQAERAALAFVDAMVAGEVSESVAGELARHFDAGERVELTLTAGLYCMVPRVISALSVPLEDDAEPGPER
jgi:AhpD family alkylhydroperoxidase